MGMQILGGADIPVSPSGTAVSYTSRGNGLVLTLVVGNSASGLPTSVTIADSAGNVWTVVTGTAPAAGTSSPVAVVAYCTSANPITSVTVTVNGVSGATYAGHIYDCTGLGAIAGTTSGNLSWNSNQEFITGTFGIAGLPSPVFCFAAVSNAQYASISVVPNASSVTGSVTSPGAVANPSISGAWGGFTVSNPGTGQIVVQTNNMPNNTGAAIPVPYAEVAFTGQPGLPFFPDAAGAVESLTVSAPPLEVVGQVTTSQNSVHVAYASQPGNTLIAAQLFELSGPNTATISDSAGNAWQYVKPTTGAVDLFYIGYVPNAQPITWFDQTGTSQITLYEISNISAITPMPNPINVVPAATSTTYTSSQTLTAGQQLLVIVMNTTVTGFSYTATLAGTGLAAPTSLASTYPSFNEAWLINQTGTYTLSVTSGTDTSQLIYVVGLVLTPSTATPPGTVSPVATDVAAAVDMQLPVLATLGMTDVAAAIESSEIYVYILTWFAASAPVPAMTNSGPYEVNLAATLSPSVGKPYAGSIASLDLARWLPMTAS